MNEDELKALWQSTNEILGGNLRVNEKISEEIRKLKVNNFLASMKPTKVFTLIAGIIWVIGLSCLIANLIVNHFGDISLFFLFSAIIQVLLTAIAIGVYIYQLDLINRIDFSEPVLVIQEEITKLKISTLNVIRLLILQLPVWTTFYWNEKMFISENWFMWILQGIVTVTFTYVSLWLFFNIKFENRNKKWFQLIFRGKEWQPILQSMELLNQIEHYQDGGEESTSH